MLPNYLRIAFRFMWKQIGFTVINIFGLTVGITCSLLILLFVQDELQYDRFHHDSDRIYRLITQGRLQGKNVSTALTPSGASLLIQNEIPETESSLRIAKWATFPVRYNEKSFTENYLLLADSNFFSFFDFRLVAGDSNTVLRSPGSIVISESAARRYFGYKGKGDNSPIGKKILLAQGYEATISGIAEDAPSNSHIHYSLILSLCTWDELKTTGWITGKVLTYFKLKAGTDIDAVDTRMFQKLKVKIDEERKLFRKIDADQFTVQGDRLGFANQSLEKIHLTSDLTDEIESNGKLEYIYLFGAIAIFITLMACINFMNLSTARSVSRAKEIGVRKTVGAVDRIIVSQFLLESFLYVVIAVLFALLFVLIFLTPFNYFTGKHLTIATLIHPAFFGGVLIFIVLVGLLAGSYPSFYLTRYSPLEIIKGRLRSPRRRYGIRNVLVVFQFFISASLIIATIVVYQQLRFLQHTDIGFEKENIINLLHAKNVGNNAVAFKKELLSHPEINSVSFVNRLPPNIDWQAAFRPVRFDKDFLLAVYEMDYDHLSTMGYTMAKGRFFSRDTKSDTLAVILNETAAKKLRLENFEGKQLFTDYDSKKGSVRNVIGIIKDFNFQSLKEPIQPLAVVLGDQPNWELAIKITPGNHDEKIRIIKNVWTKYSSNVPFEYSFVDDNFKSKQETERRVSELFIVFTVLAILIACLGLLGLATFISEQRTKEVGIRKALGATVVEIGTMLNYDILKLVLLANLIAWPFIGWVMHEWLDQFAYHITLKIWFFLVAGLATIVIAFFSVSYHAHRVARSNPVKSLRND